MTLIWEGIGLIPDDRVPEGYIGIDGPQGLELIRLKFELTVGESGPVEESLEPNPIWQMILEYGEAMVEWRRAEIGSDINEEKQLLDAANALRENLGLPRFQDVLEIG